MGAVKSGRREALLAAAAEVFLEQGYVASSIDAIIERAGGSKRNIYSEFGNKEGLFAALVGTFAEEILSSLDIENIKGRDLPDTLNIFGRRLMATYMSPALIGVYRTVVGEAGRYPELARTFHKGGPALAVARLSEVLQAAKAKGEIESEDCTRLAGHFMGLIRDNLHLEVVLGIRPAPGEKEMREAVRSAVEVFLLGVTRR